MTSAHQEGWTSLVGDPQWGSTQPVGDIGIWLIDSLSPHGGHLITRALCAGTAIATLLLLTKPWYQSHTGIRIGGAVCGALTIIGFVQERPASMVLFLFPLAGYGIGYLLCTDCTRFTPRIGGIAAAATAAGLWLFTHPSWLLPAGAATVALVMGHGGVDKRIGLMIAALLVTYLWIAGTFSKVVSISTAGRQLVEWQRTELLSAAALPLLMCLTVWVLWWRLHRPTLGELLVLALLFGTAVSAWRHIPPAVLVSLGLLAFTLDRASPTPSIPTIDERSGRVRHTVLLSTSLAVGAIGLFAHVKPVSSPQDDVVVLAEYAVCSSERQVTIASNYNDSGATIYGARKSTCTEAPDSRVALDGRADRYGPQVIAQWQQAVETGKGWEEQFHSAQATHALLSLRSNLVPTLRTAGWRALLCSGEYLVLGQPHRL